MTKEKAIKILNQTFMNADGHINTSELIEVTALDIHQALDMGIHALLLSSLPTDIDEAAEEYKQGEIDTNVDYFDETGEPLCFMATLKDAFKDGAEWQYQKDRGEFAKIKAKTWCEGFDAHKEQMLKEAVPFYEILEAVPPGPEREKVRIIIVKED